VTRNRWKKHLSDKKKPERLTTDEVVCRILEDSPNCPWKVSGRMTASRNLNSHSFVTALGPAARGLDVLYQSLNYKSLVFESTVFVVILKEPQFPSGVGSVEIKFCQCNNFMNILMHTCRNLRTYILPTRRVHCQIELSVLGFWFVMPSHSKHSNLSRNAGHAASGGALAPEPPRATRRSHTDKITRITTFPP